MKIAINTCFGGFEINNFIAKQYGIDKYEVSRTDPKLIELIESSKQSGKTIDAGRHSRVKVCTIPDISQGYFSPCSTKVSASGS